MELAVDSSWPPATSLAPLSHLKVTSHNGPRSYLILVADGDMYSQDLGSFYRLRYSVEAARNSAVLDVFPFGTNNPGKSHRTDSGLTKSPPSQLP